MNGIKRIMNKIANLLEKNGLLIKIIFVIIIAIILVKHIKPILYVGEYPSNILPVYSVIYSGSLKITDKEVGLAEKDIPSHFGRNFYNSLVKPKGLESNVRYGWYTPIYSILSVPVFIFCKIFNFDMLYFPSITNVVMIFIASMFILFILQISIFKKIMLILLLLYSPIINYYRWASSEVYIYSMVSIALVYFFNKNYKTSIFLISLTACSQPTLFAVAGGFFIIYILSIYDKNMGLYKNIIYNKENIVKGILSFFPIIFLLLYVHMATGKWQLSTVADTQTQIGMITLRYFYDYLFNLDFGLFPYIPLFLITSFIIFIKSVIIRKYDAIIFFMSILLFMFGYSLINHINCGYTQIHRYTAFTIPFIIFYVLFYFDVLTLNRKKYIYVSLILLSFVIFVIYSKKTNDYVYFSWQTKLILDNYPSLYNPQPSTFNSKVNHIDGGYSVPNIVVYSDDNKNVRKILVNKSKLKDSNEFLEYFSGDNKSINYIIEKYKNITDNKFYYINIPKVYKLHYKIEKK